MTWSFVSCTPRTALFTFYFVAISSFFSFAQNAIVTENANSGNAIAEWGVSDFRDNRIAGYATKMSLNRGETVRFKINVQTGASYTLKIYRIGYYGGSGAKLKADLGTKTGTVQPAGVSDAVTGLLDCSNWSESASWAIPATAVSGFYIAKLERAGGGSNHIAFIVRNDASNSDIYVQMPDATWQAYNGYGGNSLYDGNTAFPAGHAVKVSYNRPFFPYNSLFNTDGREADWYMNAEYPMIRWLERNGYDVTYTSCNDVARNGSRLLNHKLFLSFGHDEYWSKEHRDNVEAARNAGVHLAFFTGNEVYWKTRWENNAGTEDRTLVCYKEGTLGDGTIGERSCGYKCDPSSEWTGLWRTGEGYDAGKPENALLGQVSWVEYPAEIGVPAYYKKLRFWRNSNIAGLAEGQTSYLGVNTLGYEWDYEQPAYASYNPPGRITMSSRTINNLTHKLSLYRHSSGALVFGAGTIQWSWGLDGEHWGGSNTVSTEMQQATINLFADMNVQPGSIQGGMIQSSISTDFTKPVSTITSLANNSSSIAGTSVTISGTATDAGGGVVGGIEISTDGGLTWTAADMSAPDGNVTWTYTWLTTANGSFNVKTRAVDDSGNKENVAAGITIIVGTVDTTPPTVLSVIPSNGSSNININTNVVATFSETINSSTVTGSTFQLRDGGASLVAATITASGSQITLTPSAPLKSSTTYSVTILGGSSGVKDMSNNALPNNYVWTFTTGATGACPCMIFQTGSAPTTPRVNDEQPIELGMRFRSTQNGYITGIRYYKGTGTTGVHIGSLWNNAGTTRLAQANFVNETASGWQQVLFSTPVAVTAGVTYVASYYSPSGDYLATKPYFTQAVVNGPVTGLADGTDGANGLYRYTTSSAFPTSSFQASNYWVDVVFNTTNGTGTAPVVTTHPVGASSCAGTIVNFSSAASGTPSPTVQWQVSTNETTWLNISGSTNATLSITTTVNDNNKQYRAVWTNIVGSVNSNPATLNVTAIPSAPTVTVVNNCGSSTLTASAFTGALLWSTGATTASINVPTGGTYTVTQTVNGCTSAARSIVAAPLTAPSAPNVAVVNNCGSSTLTASAFTGALLWSTGATTASINVPAGGTYTVTQTVNGCMSAAKSIIAAPLTTPSAPSVAVVNNCGSSKLTAGSFTGSLLWSNGATTSSITVTTPGTYTVTQTVTGCTSAAGSGIAAPAAGPSAPTVAVVNNCGSSTLTAGSFAGSLLWSNGATTSSITVTTPGTYTVTQTVSGCTSAAGSGIAAPAASPTAPTVTVANTCGSSTLTAGSFTGALLWSTGATTASINVSTGGTYTVTQTVNGCTSAARSVTAAPLTGPPAPSVTVVNSCGTSTLTAGSFMGSLLWSNGATTSSTTVTTPGTYTVTQTVSGCTSAAGSGVAAPGAGPAAPTVTVVNNCSNSILTAGSYTGSLLWSTGATTASITVFTGGTYTVTQTVNGCKSAAGSVVAAPIPIPTPPTVTVVNNCGSSTLTAGGYTGSLLWTNGATTPSITVTVAGTYRVSQTINGCTSPLGVGSAAPVTSNVTAPTVTVVNSCGSTTLTAGSFTGSLLWSTGATTAAITVSTGGIYTVTQTVNGCTSPVRSATAAPVTIPSAPNVAVVNNCGSSLLTANSFTGSLLWSNGATTSSITVTTPGTYTVTQKVNGCTSAAGSGNAAPAAAPSAPGVTVVNNCGNSTLTANSFTGSLLWSNGATTSSITVTTPGTYTVTQTVSGCTSAAGSGVAAPAAGPAAPTVTVVNNCGSSTLTAGSFTGSLLWSNGATTSSITVTDAGTYTVTQTVNGCTSTAGSGIAVPAATPSAPTVTVINNCGNSTLTAGSFTGALLWSTGATTASINVPTGGTYTVSQIVNGCSSAAGSGIAAPLTAPSPPSVAVVNSCGSSTLTAGSFIGSLLWSNGATTSSITVSDAGTYTVTQTVSGCTSTAGSGIAAPVAAPSTPTVTVINNCGSSTLTASAFTGALLWSTGATTSSITVTTPGTYTVTQTVSGCTSIAGSGIAAPAASPAAPTVTVINNCGSSTLTAGSYTGALLWSTGATTASIDVPTGGTYTVTQTVNGCTSAAGSIIAAPLTSPSAPSVAVVNNCGSSTLTAGSFTGSLLWSNGATTSSITVTDPGTYTVTQTVNGCTSAAGSGIAAPAAGPSAPTVAVVNNCGSSTLTAGSFAGSLLWSNGATTSSITVTTPGTYTVTQTVSGCTSTGGSGIAAPAASPTAPTVTVVNSCGSSTLTAGSFTGALLWSTGATTASINVSTGGTYTVTQTVDGCTSTARSVTAAPLTGPPAPTVTVVNSCGSSKLTAGSFTGSLLWSNGATTSSITVSDAGTYTVTQTVSGCTSAAGSGIAAPVAGPAAPTVTVVNNCSSSILTAGSYTGSLLWSTGVTTASITARTAGTYTVTQTVNGCKSAVTSVVAAPIPIPTPPTVTVVNNCGSSTLTAGGYTGSLLWTNGATTPSITVTVAGTYRVSQTINGCTSPLGVGSAAPVSSNVAAPTVTVVNSCGSTTLTAGSFTGSLLWSTGATTASITVSTGGIYTVTQTVNGCTSPARSGTAAPLTTPSAPGVTVVNNCGSSILTANSFTGPLLWSNGATTSSITVTTPGTYTVTQKVNSCTSAAGSGIAAPAAAPSAPGVTVVNNCGSSTLTANSFTGSLLWSNGATSSSITVTTPGTYTVTQTESGCTSAAGSGIAAPVAAPSAPTVTVVNHCGSSTLTAVGFTGSLLWSNGATTSSITVTETGTYTVTQTVSGCTGDAGIGIAAPLATPSAPTVTVVNSCGNSTLTAGSFTGSLLWSNGATTSSITVSDPGTYTVTQTVSGCTSTAGSGIAAPAAGPAAPTVTVVDNCGSSTLTAGSFTGSLLWNTGATTASITVSTGGIYTVTQTVNGCTSTAGSGIAAPVAAPSTPTVTVINNCGSSTLTASAFTGALLWSTGATTSSITVTTPGTYIVTQTVSGCTSIAGSGIAAPAASPAAPTVTVINNCGSSTLTAGSYTGTLLWSTGATTASIDVPTGGTYTVTQTVNGCTSAAGSIIAAPLTSPSAPSVAVVNNCGSSTLTAGSFTGSLLWSNGATTSSITVTDPGTYTVTQTVNGCTSAAGSGIAAPAAGPSAPTVAVVNNCGSSTLTAGSFAGSLLWSNGATTSSITVTTPGTYTVTQTVSGCASTGGSGIAAPATSPAAPTVTVVNSCGGSTLTAGSFTGALLWSTGVTTASINVSTGGTYTVTQTVDGCTSTARSVTAAPLTGPPAPSVTVVNSCGSSKLTAGSFTGSLLWSNGATTSSITVSDAGTYTVTQTVSGCTSAAGSGIAAPVAGPAAPTVTVVNNCSSSILTAGSYTGSLLWSTGVTTASITARTAGTYTVTQTVNGCKSAVTSVVAAPIPIPTPPTVTVVNNCGSSTLTAGGYTGSLLWTNGATTPSITVTVAGTYRVSQTINGCTSPLGVGSAAPVSSNVAAPTVTVVNNCGSTTLTAGSFTGSLLWSTGATTASITVSTGGIYTVTQTVNGCTSPARSGTAAPLTTPSAPGVTVVNNCGSSILTANSFTGSLLWSNGATTSSITVTTPGTYTVTQKVNSCTSAAGSGIAAPAAAPSAPGVTVVNNCGSSTLTANSFTGSLLWSNGATSSSITVTTPGTYTVTQTESGCTSAAGSGIAAPVAAPSAPTVTVVNHCGSSTLTAVGFTGSLLWSNGATTSSITVTETGTYTVTQTVSGCTGDAGIGIAAPLATPSAPTVTVVNSCGNSTLTAGSFTGSLLWSNGATTSSITVSDPGTYTVTQTVSGCTSTAGSGIAAPAAGPAAPTVTVTNSCGSSTLTAGSFIGSLLWSNGATTSSITVTTPGTYTVTQTVSGCTSTAGSGIVAPGAGPAAPTVTVVNSCGSSTLTAGSFTGVLLWSTGATTASINVPTVGTYTVTQTVDGCTSAAGIVTAAPLTVPSTPAVTVVNNCGSSTLTASAFTGSLLWSNGATTSSITVTDPGTYTVTQTVSGCTSSAGSGIAAPPAGPAAPTVTVVDNCGSSTLNAGSFTGSLLWSTGATTASIDVLTGGTYTVTQTINGCTSAAGSGIAAPLTSPSAPSVAVVNNCGSSTLTAGSFTGSLLWSNGATTSSITVTDPGTYTVTQTVSGCTSTAGSGIAAPAAGPSAPTVTVVNNCGSSTLTAGSFAGSLLWSNGATTSSITVTTPGTYTVTQTVSGCTSAAGSGISAPLNSNVSAPTVTVINNCGSSTLTAGTFTGALLWNTGATTASINVSTGGTYTVTQTVNGCTSAAGSVIAAPLTSPSAPSVAVVNNCGSSTLTAGSFTGSLLWSNGATTSSITVTDPGTYTVTQTVSGCTSTAGSGIAAPAVGPSAPTVTVVNNCGSSTLTAGSFAGSLLWSNGATSSSITVTDPGTYTVIQTVNGCTSAVGSGIAAPAAIPAAPTVTVINNCGNSTLTAGVFTGSLLWSNGATTSSITVTEAGTYTVTQTVSGCTSAAGSGIAAPAVGPAAPTVTVVNSCSSSTLTAGSFTGSLLWSNGATSSSITVTTPGTYTVTQTVNGCTSAAGSGIAAPAVGPAAPTVTVVNSCGSSTLTAGSFTGSLLWSNGATSSSITVTDPGTYTVIQTVNGCTSAVGSGIAAPAAIPAAPTVTVINNCGNSTLTAGVFTGSLLWSNGATSSSITVTDPGIYTVIQTVNGCTSAAGSGIAAPAASPAAPTVTVINNCGNSTLTAGVFTGSLLWSNGATTSSITVTEAGTYTVTQTVNGCTSAAGSGIAAPAAIPAAPTVTVINNCGNSTLTAGVFTGSLLWSNGATTSSITVTDPGTYTVTQTVNGCTSAAGSGIAAPAAIPAAPTVTVINSCGSSTLTAGSITGSLLWSNGATTSSITVTTPGTYTLTQTVSGCTSAAGSGLAAPAAAPVAPTVTIVNSCGSSTLTAGSFTGALLWSTGATTTFITVPTGGTYTVTETVNGCTSEAAVGIAAPLTAPSAPGVTVVNNCGSSTLTADAFTGSLLWSNGATTSSITVTDAGTYTVTQTVSGCTSVAGSGIAAPAPIPAAPTVTVVNNCGSSTLNAGSFTGSLLWNTGATTAAITVASAGTYTVTETVNGCTSAAGIGIAAPSIAPSAPSVSVVNNCNNSTLTATGFTGDLLWSTGATTTSITVTTPGTYTVTQTVNGCTSPSASGSAAPLATSLVAPTVTVANACNNTSTLTASGFTGSLLWSNGATTPAITVTTAGTYSVTQTVSGCISAEGSGIAAPKQSPVLTSSQVLTVNSGVAFTYTPASSIPGTAYSWDRAVVPGISNSGASGTGSISEVLVNTTAEPVIVTYVYTLIADGCTSTQSIAVTVNAPAAVVNCRINGSITSNFTSAEIPAGRYIWFNSVFDRGTITGSEPVTFTITNSVITFSANDVQYVLPVPNATITFDALTSTASTEFINNVWVTKVPRTFNSYAFMTGLSYLVPTNFPGGITDINWSADIAVNQLGVALTWKWAAAAYSSFETNAGLNIKPINGTALNPYPNLDEAGTPENFKETLVAGAKGLGGTNYTGNYTSTATATCSTAGQRTTESPFLTRKISIGNLDGLKYDKIYKGKLDAEVTPNPSSNFFTIAIKGTNESPVTVRIVDIFGRVVEQYEKIAANTTLRIGHKWTSGSYFAEVIQGNQRRIVKIIKAN